MRELAIIIIGRNEARHLSRCILSVLKGSESVPDTQIVYVDSASTDQSVRIASAYPIDILRLKDDWFLSAAAGRYTGFLHTESRYIFFIDGDSVLFRNWLTNGIRFLKAHPEIAGTAGVVHENMLDAEGRIERIRRNRYGQRNPVEETRTLGGIALYRREALLKSGSFHPYIQVDEERELALRIRSQGYALVRILEPMAVTYGPSRETVREILRRYHGHLYTFGRTLRHCQAEGFFTRYLFERLSFITTTIAGFVVVLLATVIAVWSGLWHLILAVGVGLVILFLLLKRNRLHEIGTSLLKRFLMTWRTIQSYFTTRPLAMDTYPRDVIVVRKTGQAGG